MLGVGDVLRVETVITNSGTGSAYDLELLSDFPMTVCEPDFLNNTIIELMANQSVLCVSSKTIDALDLIEGERTHVFDLDNETQTIQVFFVTDTIPEMMIMFDESIDFGPDFILSSGDELTIMTKIINTGNQTLLNVTSRFGVIPVLEPMQYVVYNDTYILTQGQIDAGTLELTEVFEGIAISTLETVIANKTFLANITQDLYAAMAVTTSGMTVIQNGCSAPGDSVMYTITVENMGEETLMGVTVQDSAIASLVCSPLNVDNSIGMMIPMQQETCVGSFVSTPSSYTAPNFGVLRSEVTVTGYRVTTDVPFAQIVSSNFDFGTESSLRLIDTRHSSTSSTGRGTAVWTILKINTLPSAWLSRRVFVAPETGVYEMRAAVRSLTGGSIMNIRINNVIISWPSTNVGGIQYFEWSGTLNAGNTLDLYDDTTFNGLAQVTGSAGTYFCVLKPI